MALLEKQNNLFTYTADKLYHMTKENLVCARLPHFHIPAAVETLTTGKEIRVNILEDFIVQCFRNAFVLLSKSFILSGI